MGKPRAPGFALAEKDSGSLGTHSQPDFFPPYDTNGETTNVYP